MNIFPYTIIDIEASGTGSCSYPIEIAVVTTENQRYEALLAPEPDWIDWEESAQEIHGITRDTLVRDGQDIRQVCSQLNRLCRDNTVYSDCWSFDSRWLQTLFAAAGMAMDFRCSALENVLSDTELEQWAQQKGRCHQTMQLPSHRALNDALVMATVAEQLIAKRSQITMLEKIPPFASGRNLNQPWITASGSM